MTETPPIDWRERGKQHFENCRRSKGATTVDYPTQDIHTPQDEAAFARGFEEARRAWAGRQLAPEDADDGEISEEI